MYNDEKMSWSLFLLVLWEVPYSIRAYMSAWVLWLTLRKLFSVSITASTQPWLTSTPTTHCGRAPNTPPRKSLHWPGATASTDTGFIQFAPSKLRSQHLEDVHCQSQLRARGPFLLCLAAVLRGEYALLWHIYAWLGCCVLYRCVFLVLI